MPKQSVIPDQIESWFFYDVSGRRIPQDEVKPRSYNVYAVSSIPLPEPSRGPCAHYSRVIDKAARIGRRMDIAILDPFILKRLALIGMGSRRYMPKSFAALLNMYRSERVWWTFRYPKTKGGGLLFVECARVCLAREVRI